MPTRRIGATSVASLIAAFMSTHPQVTVTAEHVGGSPQLMSAVRDASLDLAFLSVPTKAVSGVELVLLATQPIVLVCHRDHRLVGDGPLRLVDLAAETFVELPPGWGSPVVVEQAYAELDLERDVRYRANDLNVLVDFVTHDLGVALLPESHVPPDPDLATVAVEDAPRYAVQLALPTNRMLGAAARAFAEGSGPRGEPGPELRQGGAQCTSARAAPAPVSDLTSISAAFAGSGRSLLSTVPR